jgi:hypothetical protein
MAIEGFTGIGGKVTEEAQGVCEKRSGKMGGYDEIPTQNTYGAEPLYNGPSPTTSGLTTSPGCC